MLNKLMSMGKAQLQSTLQSLDISAVKGRSLKRKFEKIRSKKEGGFTLLELLVVVAILAAIAGTATIMLQDTDRKGAAAAHVAMMDELSKGIQTFRVLNGGLYPDIWDSLLGDGGVAAGGLSAIISDDLAGNLSTAQLTDTRLGALNNVGIFHVRELLGTGSCTDADIRAYVSDKNNDVVPQNIYRSADANGCGKSTHTELAEDDYVAIWNDSLERVGVPLQAITDGVVSNEDLIAFGVGPDSSLFNPSIIGALSNVPVYRHVASDEYNRFIVLFNANPVIQQRSLIPATYWDDDNDPSTPDVVQTPAHEGTTWKTGGGQAIFQAIIDGAGDTKDEELGEVDNVRPT